jgi:hypothetical protein
MKFVKKSQESVDYYPDDAESFDPNDSCEMIRTGSDISYKGKQWTNIYRSSTVGDEDFDPNASELMFGTNTSAGLHRDNEDPKLKFQTVKKPSIHILDDPETPDYAPGSIQRKKTFTSVNSIKGGSFTVEPKSTGPKPPKNPANPTNPKHNPSNSENLDPADPDAAPQVPQPTRARCNSQEVDFVIQFGHKPKNIETPQQNNSLPDNNEILKSDTVKSIIFNDEGRKNSNEFMGEVIAVNSELRQKSKEEEFGRKTTQDLEMLKNQEFFRYIDDGDAFVDNFDELVLEEKVKGWTEENIDGAKPRLGFLEQKMLDMANQAKLAEEDFVEEPEQLKKTAAEVVKQDFGFNMDLLDMDLGPSKPVKPEPSPSRDQDSVVVRGDSLNLSQDIFDKATPKPQVKIPKEAQPKTSTAPKKTTTNFYKPNTSVGSGVRPSATSVEKPRPKSSKKTPKKTNNHVPSIYKGYNVYTQKTVADPNEILRDAKKKASQVELQDLYRQSALKKEESNFYP